MKETKERREEMTKIGRDRRKLRKKVMGKFNNSEA